MAINFEYSNGAGLYGALLSGMVEAQQKNAQIAVAQQGAQADLMRAMTANSAAQQDAANHADDRNLRAAIATAEMQSQADKSSYHELQQGQRDTQQAQQRYDLLNQRFDRRSELQDQAAGNRNDLMENRFSLAQRREIEGLNAEQSSLDRWVAEQAGSPHGLALAQQWQDRINVRRRSIRPMPSPALPQAPGEAPAPTAGGGPNGVLNAGLQPGGNERAPGTQQSEPADQRFQPHPELRGHLIDSVTGTTFHVQPDGSLKPVDGLRGPRDISPNEWIRMNAAARQALTSPTNPNPSEQEISDHVNQQIAGLEQMQRDRRSGGNATAGVRAQIQSLFNHASEWGPDRVTGRENGVTSSVQNRLRPELAPAIEPLRQMLDLIDGRRLDELTPEQRTAFLDAASRLPESLARRIRIPPGAFGGQSRNAPARQGPAAPDQPAAPPAEPAAPAAPAPPPAGNGPLAPRVTPNFDGESGITHEQAIRNVMLHYPHRSRAQAEQYVLNFRRSIRQGNPSAEYLRRAEQTGLAPPP